MAETVALTPLAEESIRILESPSVAWAQRANEAFARGDRREEARPWAGTLLGIDVVRGIARVSEALTMAETDGWGQAVAVPLWHVFVRDLHFRDITPAERPPVFPLPGYKPYRGTARANPTPDAPRTRVVRVPLDSTTE